MRPRTLFLLAPVAFAAKAPRIRHVASVGKNMFTNILLDTCPIGYDVCEDGCMRVGDTCCNDGTSESCEPGYYCIPDACCLRGQDCGEDTSTICDAGDVQCGDNYCMPSTGTCCSGQGYYCPDFGICTNDGHCCDLGDDCDSNGGGGGNGSVTSSAFTPALSSVSSDDSDGYLTSTLSEPTSTGNEDGSPTATITIIVETTGIDSADFVFPTITVGDEHGSSKSIPPSITSVTVTVSPSSIPPRPGQAGGHHRADGRVAAGIAIAAALLI
ncbi:hypothetical protein CHU98_g4148 [Xylaria longipes]|nr:hypothetical protein CHU98_g4148 [Xylaria longipes]